MPSPRQPSASPPPDPGPARAEAGPSNGLDDAQSRPLDPTPEADSDSLEHLRDCLAHALPGAAAEDPAGGREAGPSPASGHGLPGAALEHPARGREAAPSPASGHGLPDAALEHPARGREAAVESPSETSPEREAAVESPSEASPEQGISSATQPVQQADEADVASPTEAPLESQADLNRRQVAVASRIEMPPQQGMPFAPPAEECLDEVSAESSGEARPQRPDQEPTWNPPPLPEQTRDVIRLFQCPRCSSTYTSVRTMPCGRSLCRACLPRPPVRNSSRQAGPPQRVAFRCPFPECHEEHAVDDCGHDVILEKACQVMREEFGRNLVEASKQQVLTSLRIERPPAPLDAPRSPRGDNASLFRVLGGKVVATWGLCISGLLKYDAPVTYPDAASASASSLRAQRELDVKFLCAVQRNMRPDMDCQICYSLLSDPLTTRCGHTFCRSCLDRVLDYSWHCPLCRQRLRRDGPLFDRSAYPSNQRVVEIIQTFWKIEASSRLTSLDAEAAARDDGFDTPLFPYSLSFPLMPTLLPYPPRRLAPSNRKSSMPLNPPLPPPIASITPTRMATHPRIEPAYKSITPPRPIFS